MALKQYRCIVGQLNIRSQPRTSDEFKTGDVLTRHEVITVDDANSVDAEGFAWVKHDRGWSAERPLDGRFIFLSDAVMPKDRLWGINVDPNNPQDNPPPDRLLGVGWVRFVFHVDSRRETLEQAFAFYDPIIQAYARNRTRIILIVLQDTYWGNAPWTNGDWAGYARSFAERLGMIARRYKGLVAAYQIWNEPDMVNQPTSISVAPDDYAVLLAELSNAVMLADPGALVLGAGMATGAGETKSG